jgi:hypothetical protein
LTAVGRTDGIWCMDITACDVASADETYKLHCSARTTWPSATATSNCWRSTISPRRPPAARSRPSSAPRRRSRRPTLAGTILQLPFTNLMQRIYYRYLRVYAVIGGTTPSITLTSWISRAGIDV